MISSSVAGIIFANAYDEKVQRLTAKRSIASVPFGGRYRLIDFCLSNLVNAGVSNVGIITKEKYRSLMDHIGSGIYWDLDRKSGGIRLLPPFNISKSRIYQGYVEALYGAKDFMVRCNAKYIVLCDARTVANVDLKEVIKLHKLSNADITVVCTKGTEIKDNNHTITLDINKDGSVALTGVPNKIGANDIRSMDIYVFNRDKLIELVENSYENGGITVCEDIVAANFGKLKVMAYEHKGYVAEGDISRSFVAEGDKTFVVFVQFCRLGQNSLILKVMSRFCQVLSFCPVLSLLEYISLAHRLSGSNLL